VAVGTFNQPVVVGDNPHAFSRQRGNSKPNFPKSGAHPHFELSRSEISASLSCKADEI
jgi:hypothetical protein